VPHSATQILEGSYRVVATEVLPAGKPRKSPNRERAVARIFFWNAAFLAALVVLPQLVG
jgi:hypothetical protein